MNPSTRSDSEKPRLPALSAKPVLVLGACLLGALCFSAAAAEKLPPGGAFAEWLEPDFPFFSSVLDARKAGAGLPGNNLTPRGLVLNLGHGSWACFDTDLLRVSAVWEGNAVTPAALAPLSYHDFGLKTQDGQSKLPLPQGRVWLANGIYPGWQIGNSPSLTDPREPTPSPEEVGRGPLPAAMGRFQAVRLVGGGVRLEYRVGSTEIHEWMSASGDRGTPVFERRFRLDASANPLILLLAKKREAAGGKQDLAVSITNADGASVAELIEDGGVWAVKVPAHSKPVAFRISLSPDRAALKPESGKLTPVTDLPSAARWPQNLKTKAVRSTEKNAYVLDDIPLPTDNPWRRSIRLADVEFFRDGSAAGVTFDGDVWMIRGLGSESGEVLWKRFAAGFHEPMSLAIRDGQIHVYDRNGIWRLRDTNGDGEADVHEMFCSAFTQTAETREFPSSMKLAPDGSFVISKGGQQSTTLGRHNGSVLRVSPDGGSVSVLGWGFRGPFVGVHPVTGLVTASDQEGHYVPTTPLYIVKDGEYHGHLSQLLPKEKYPAPIADPLTWIPHPVNPSGVTQVWLTDPRMGPLTGAMIHIGYTRPELFVVRMNNRSAKPQASVTSLTHEIPFAPLNGAVNPADGQLYITGFRGWGTTATKSSGIMRVRYTGAPCFVPHEVAATDKGILLRFDVELDARTATDLASYSIERWNYRRTANYGSPHLKLDGTPGQEWMQPSSVYLAKDRKGVFIGLPGLEPVMQMRVGWSLASQAGATFENSAYLTPHELPGFIPASEGFDDVPIDLTPKAAVARAHVQPTIEEGKRLYQFLGCAACHSTDGTLVGRIGPSWKGIFGSERKFADGSSQIADEAYLRQSIMEPAAKVVRGFEKSDAGMPSYGGIMTDSQIESLILFIKTVR
jgi:cytochrome c551/c552